MEPSEFNREWRYEQCRLLVDEAGVALLEYDAPCAVERIEVEAATLLPFSKIQEIFEKMVLIVNNNADVNGSDQRYIVTEVRLSLVSVPEQNGDGGLLVPCWDFFGVSRRDRGLSAPLADAGPAAPWGLLPSDRQRHRRQHHPKTMNQRTKNGESLRALRFSL